MNTRARTVEMTSFIEECRASNLKVLAPRAVVSILVVLFSFRAFTSDFTRETIAEQFLTRQVDEFPGSSRIESVEQRRGKKLKKQKKQKKSNATENSKNEYSPSKA